MSRLWGRVWVAVVPVALVALLVLPVAASAAPKGVLGVFGGAGTGPGQFSSAATGLRAVGVDPNSGDVYVVDAGNHRVQRFTAAGVFVSQLGSGSVGTAGGLFNTPTGVGVDPADGSVYVSDSLNLRVQKFSSTGSFVRAFGWDTIIAAGPPPNSNGTSFEVCDTTALVPNLSSDCKNGVGGTGNGQFGSAPAPFTGAPAVDPSTGAVYVADPGASGANGRRIQRFNGATGAFEGRWGGQGTGPGQFGAGLAGGASPHRLAVDSTGAVYAVDYGANGGANSRVQKCVPSGVAPTVTATCTDFIAPVDAFSGGAPLAVAIGPADHVFVVRRTPGSNNNPVVVQEYTPAGVLVETHGQGVGIGDGAPANATSAHTGLAVNKTTGRIYLTVPSATNPRVWILDDVPAPSVTVDTSTDVTSDTAIFHATVTPSATGPSGVTTSYRFEYSFNNGIDWVPATESFNDLGNGSGSGDPSSCPAGNPPSCEVSLAETGLDPGETYRLRVVARTEFGGAQTVVEGPAFSTPSAPPSVTTGPGLWSSPADTDPTLLLTGQVNPRGAQATYRFEYVTDARFAESGFDQAEAIPVTPADAGAGRSNVVVRRSVSGLDPTVAYRYRLVASNGAGQADGAPASVAAPDSDARFYELVSVGESWGGSLSAGTSVESISDDGVRAGFLSMAFGDVESVPGVVNTYISERGEDGWEVHAPVSPGERVSGDFGLDRQPLVAADMRSVIVPEAGRMQRWRAEVQWMWIGLDGTRTPASGLIKPVSFDFEPNNQSAYLWQGGSSDLSTFAFAYNNGAGATVRLLEDEQLLTGINNQNLYAITGAAGPSPVLTLVNRVSDSAPGVPGAPLGGVCGAGLGGNLNSAAGNSGYRAISEDGSVIYFTAAPDAPDSGDPPCTESVSPKRVFKRVDGVSTVAVSESQCVRVAPVCEGTGDDRYQGASTDGEKVFFTSGRQLTDSDLDVNSGPGFLGCGGGFGIGCDLYLYDAAPPTGQPNLVQVSAGEANPDHPTVGSGAGVMDFLDSSKDGSRVYFAATGALTGQNRRGVAPIAGDPTTGPRNVYVYERDDDHPGGRIEYVGPSNANEAPAFTALEDGVMLFATTAAVLPGEDTDTARDVYHYDDQTGTIECLSCGGDGALDAEMTGSMRQAVARPHLAQMTRAATPDGSAVVFVTAESLLAEDVNTALDVYLWRQGEGLSLVSGGTGPLGVEGRSAQSAAGTSRSAGISPDGQSVFFKTEAPLVATDGDGRPDLYVARVGGGFPASDTPAEPCDPGADNCQGGGADVVSGPVATSETGSGNQPATARARLAMRAPSTAARRRAARTGVLAAVVRTTVPGEVSVRALARLGGRSVTVARGKTSLQAPGRATVRLRLSGRARRALRDGRSLRIRVIARQAGARSQTTAVVLRRAGR